MINKNKIISYCDRGIFTCLCLLIFCLPFAKAGMETFTWMAIFLWLFKRALGYRADSSLGMFPKTELNKALGVFIVFNALSMVFSYNFGLSLRGFFGKGLKFIAIYFMLVEVINNKKRLRIILFTIIASAILVTVDAGAQLLKGKDFLRGYSFSTFNACFNTSTGFAGWLIVIIPLLVGLICAKIIPSWKLKILISVVVIIQSLYLLMTFSRGAWLGFVVAIILLFFYIFKNFKFKMRLLCVCFIIFLSTIYLIIPRSSIVKAKDVIKAKIFFNKSIGERIKLVSQLDKGSVSERIMWWREALRIIKDYPLNGCGLNTYSRVALGYKSFSWGGIYPHNSYLQMTAEIGLLGLFAFILVLFIFFKICLRYLADNKSILVAGFLSGILAFLVHAFFDTHFYSLQLVVLFWYMLGLTVAIIKLKVDKI